MSSPTARTLGRLRECGYVCEIVERWIPRLNRRKDFLGIGDVLGIRPGLPLLLIQCTSAGNTSSRISKALRSPGLRIWLRTGCEFRVWGWAGPKLKETPITLADTQGVPIAHRPPRRKRHRAERGLFDPIHTPPTPANTAGAAESTATGIVGDDSNRRHGRQGSAS
jgi:hypothetical protein